MTISSFNCYGFYRLHFQPTHRLSISIGNRPHHDFFFFYSHILPSSCFFFSSNFSYAELYWPLARKHKSFEKPINVWGWWREHKNPHSCWRVLELREGAQCRRGCNWMAFGRKKQNELGAPTEELCWCGISGRAAPPHLRHSSRDLKRLNEP